MTDSLSPRQRWGTCCPFDPQCEHSFMDNDVLTRWMDTPITCTQTRECFARSHDLGCPSGPPPAPNERQVR